MGVGPVPYDLFLDGLAQRWGCRPSEVEDEDAERVDRILEAAGIQRIFETPGSRWSDADREIFGQLLDMAPSPRARKVLLGRHAKVSGET